MPITKDLIDRMKRILAEIEVAIGELDQESSEAKRLAAAARDVRHALADLTAKNEGPDAEQ